VTFDVPLAAVAVALKVSAVLPEPTTFDGLNVAITPVGLPAWAKFTEPINPPEGTIVKVVWPDVPFATVSATGDAERVKFPGEFSSSLTVELRVKPPLVADTVKG
jgi:hypothetical protein